LSCAGRCTVSLNRSTPNNTPNVRCS